MKCFIFISIVFRKLNHFGVGEILKFIFDFMTKMSHVCFFGN